MSYEMLYIGIISLLWAIYAMANQIKFFRFSWHLIPCFILNFFFCPLGIIIATEEIVHEIKAKS